ncbi:MAG: hypothetical protein HQ596_00790 [Candidatus Saganbacteria bacterium]|nr:hypothetical protein [Candidatus Saganbacteria bacterium]
MKKIILFSLLLSFVLAPVCFAMGNKPPQEDFSNIAPRVFYGYDDEFDFNRLKYFSVSDKSEAVDEKENVERTVVDLIDKGYVFSENGIPGKNTFVVMLTTTSEAKDIEVYINEDQYLGTQKLLQGVPGESVRTEQLAQRPLVRKENQKTPILVVLVSCYANDSLGNYKMIWQSQASAIAANGENILGLIDLALADFPNAVK